MKLGHPTKKYYYREEVIGYFDVNKVSIMCILEETSTSTVLYVAIGVLFTVILILLASIVIIYYRKKKNPLPEAKTPPTAQNRYF